MRDAMMRKMCAGVVGVVLGAICTASASAALIAEYSGNTDPTSMQVTLTNTAKWATGEFDLTSLGSTVASPASWRINDNKTNAALSYQYVTKSRGGMEDQDVWDATAADAWTNGFTLSLNVRVNTIDQAPGSAITGQYGNNSQGYVIALGSDTTGQPQVQVNGGATYTILDDAAGMPQFHLYQLIYNSTANKAALYVDGSALSLISNISPSKGFTDKYPRLLWGSGSSGATGSADYALVRLESTPVPEPTSLCLLGLGRLLLIRRRRKA